MRRSHPGDELDRAVRRLPEAHQPVGRDAVAFLRRLDGGLARELVLAAHVAYPELPAFMVVAGLAADSKGPEDPAERARAWIEWAIR